jgi:hypothetical protein
MSAITKHGGPELEAPEGRTTTAASQDVPFSHLHFDRRLRVWRGHADIPVEATPRDEELDTPQLRLA